MPTAPTKRRLEDLTMPSSKRTKTSLGAKGTHNSNYSNSEDNTTSPVGKMFGSNFRNFMSGIERKPTKKVARKSSRKSNEALVHNSTKTINKIPEAPYTKVSSINSPYSKSLPRKKPLMTPISNILSYSCRSCWRKYPLRSHVVRHSHTAHRVHRSPVSCMDCGRAFSGNIGQGPWKDCCTSSMRKYCIQRTFM